MPKPNFLIIAFTTISLFLLPACAPAPAENAETGVTSQPRIETAEIEAPLPTQTPTELPMSTEINSASTANANVEFVRAVVNANGTWTFHVTLSHPDTGWEDYADGWDVVLPDGTAIKPQPDSPFTRLLLHPHENEQPFTRSQSGILIPEGITQVTVRGHDLVDGFGGVEVIVFLNTDSGEGYEVVRNP